MLADDVLLDYHLAGELRPEMSLNAQFSHLQRALRQSNNVMFVRFVPIP